MARYIDLDERLVREAREAAEDAKDVAHTAFILALVSFFLSVLGLIVRAVG